MRSLLLATYTHALSHMRRDPVLAPSVQKRVGTRGKARAVQRQIENNFLLANALPFSPAGPIV